MDAESVRKCGEERKLLIECVNYCSKEELIEPLGISEILVRRASDKSEEVSTKLYRVWLA